MKQWFLKTKPCSVLLLLRDSNTQWYPSKLARASNSSYVHTVNLLGDLKADGMVELEKKGRQSFYKLSEKGMHAAMALDEFAKRCGTPLLREQAKQEETPEPSSGGQPHQESPSAQKSGEKKQ